MPTYYSTSPETGKRYRVVIPEEDDSPAIRKFFQSRDAIPPTVLSVARMLGSTPLQAMASLPQTLQGSLIRAAASPTARLSYPLIGMELGGQFGGGLPGAVAGSGLGGAISRAIEPGPQGQELPPGGDILRSGLLNALLPVGTKGATSLAKGVQRGAQFIRTGKAFSSPEAEAAFIDRVRKFLKELPERAGRHFKESFVEGLVKDNPSGTGDFSRSLGRIRARFQENPEFLSHMQERLADLSPEDAAIVQRHFPELTVARVSGRVSEGARGLRLSPEEVANLEQRVRQLGAGVTETVAAESPTTVTFQDSQVLKHFFRKPFLGFVGKEAYKIPAIADEARIAWYALKADQVGNFPGFEQASDTIHRSLDDYRKLQQATGNFSDTGLPRALASDFHGTDFFGSRRLGQAPAHQAAYLRTIQDAPELGEEIARYRGAANFQNYRNTLLRRAALWGPLSLLLGGPLYGARRTLGQAFAPRTPTRRFAY